jgi:hypothetical protein
MVKKILTPALRVTSFGVTAVDVHRVRADAGDDQDGRRTDPRTETSGKQLRSLA